MAATPTQYHNIIKHYPEQSSPTPEMILGDFYLDDESYLSRAVVRARTRYTNRSRFKDEEMPSTIDY